MPTAGPTLLLGNHDSARDPLVVAAALRSRRHIRALARNHLWEHRLLARGVDAIGQIPVDPRRGDVQASGAAAVELAAGACIGVFPQGTVSRGLRPRARSGAGRLAVAVPEAHVLGVAVTGTVDIARFPRRPELRVHFFLPAGGGCRSEESAGAFTARIMAEVRRLAPVPGEVRGEATGDARH